MTSLNNSYQSKNKLDQNDWITDPRVEDPINLPEPLGYQILVRPYPIVANAEKSSILRLDDEINFLNHITNIARIVAIGPCCWNKAEHHKQDGTQEWVKVGDFVSFPKNMGGRRKYKGVSYVLLNDDELSERLPDPQVFDDAYYKIDLPDEHLTKYNSYKKDTQ